MNRALPKHHQKIVEILSRAFNENQSVNYIIKQDRKRKVRIRKLMEYSLGICQAFGDVWISEDCSACALILIPDRKLTSFRTILWDIKLAFSVIGLARIPKVLKRENQIKTLHPSSPYFYLWFIGVDPDDQANGKGSRLLSEIMQYYQDRPIYLETSVESNLPWYEKFGFEIFQTINIGYTLYLMKKDH